MTETNISVAVSLVLSCWAKMLPLLYSAMSVRFSSWSPSKNCSHTPRNSRKKFRIVSDTRVTLPLSVLLAWIW